MMKNAPPPPLRAPYVTFLYQQELEWQGGGDGVKEVGEVPSFLADLPEKCFG